MIFNFPVRLIVLYNESPFICETGLPGERFRPIKELLFVLLNQWHLASFKMSVNMKRSNHIKEIIKISLSFEFLSPPRDTKDILQMKMWFESPYMVFRYVCLLCVIHQTGLVWPIRTQCTIFDSFPMNERVCFAE